MYSSNFIKVELLIERISVNSYFTFVNKLTKKFLKSEIMEINVIIY